MVLGIGAFIGLIFGMDNIYIIGYITGMPCGLILVIYLPSLFIYKLYQVNKIVMENMIPTTGNKSPDPSSETRSKSKSKTENECASTQSDRDNSMIMVIRKCTILTTISLLSTLTVFVFVMIFAFSGGNIIINAIWAFMVVVDSNMNFICVMLSNNFLDEFYLKLCGCIDNCVGKCCFESKENMVMNKQETALSSYMEATIDNKV